MTAHPLWTRCPSPEPFVRNFFFLDELMAFTRPLCMNIIFSLFYGEGRAGASPDTRELGWDRDLDEVGFKARDRISDIYVNQ
jgi:hypothetical protein